MSHDFFNQTRRLCARLSSLSRNEHHLCEAACQLGIRDLLDSDDRTAVSSFWIHVREHSNVSHSTNKPKALEARQKIVYALSEGRMKCPLLDKPVTMEPRRLLALRIVAEVCHGSTSGKNSVDSCEAKCEVDRTWNCEEDAGRTRKEQSKACQEKLPRRQHVAHIFEKRLTC